MRFKSFFSKSGKHHGPTHIYNCSSFSVLPAEMHELIIGLLNENKTLGLIRNNLKQVLLSKVEKKKLGNL